MSEGQVPRYELIDKDGNIQPGFYADAYHAAACARALWPDQEQDEERTGNGWDVQVVGAGDSGTVLKPPPYPFCRTPEKCAGKGYCPRDIACND